MDFASKEKVAAGFRAVGQKFQNVVSDVDDVKRDMKGLRRSMRGALSMRGADDSGKYFWGSADAAKQFGEIVLCAVNDHAHKDMGIRVDTAGGILAPEELVERFIDLLGKFGKFQMNATSLPLSGSAATVPQLVDDLVVYSPGEGEDIDMSDLKLAGVKLMPKTWAALTAVSNELFEDSVIAIGEIVGKSMARAFARQLDEVGFNGTGTAAHFGHCGILGSFLKIVGGDPDDLADAAGIQPATANGWNGVSMNDLVGLIGLLPSQFDDGAKIYCSKAFYYGVVYKQALAHADASLLELLSTLRPRSLAGYEVEFVDVMPSATPAPGTKQIPVWLGNLEYASYIGHRRELVIEQSRDVLFSRNQTAIRGVSRIDVNVFGCGDTSEPGPIVGLLVDGGEE